MIIFIYIFLTLIEHLQKKKKNVYLKIIHQNIDVKVLFSVQELQKPFDDY